ncbi:MAG: dUTP diphosphatase [Spirochaetales bacterium]|nr:dUTP diphosphatase [Spirochaetales bacterium]
MGNKLNDFSGGINITLDPGAIMPSYATEDSSGADICAYLPDSTYYILEPGAFALIPTGIRMEISPGFEVQIRPRSGLAAKSGITVLNTPGTIDADYRGEVKVILINHSEISYTIEHGSRIAQMVFAEVRKAEFQLTHKLNITRRGEGGFGSTGT